MVVELQKTLDVAYEEMEWVISFLKEAQEAL
jgi:hypothetical protein